MSGFERSLLLARLGQYAERTDMWRPSAIDDAWVEQMMDRLDLVRPIGDDKVPTLAGWLLFSGNPSEQFAQARVQFQATGPAHWLKGRFGDDIDLEEAEQPGDYTVRRTITGNLWSQLDELTDLLALINFQFRLKAEISRTVNAYHPLAVKEMIVNAIVHRDYERDEPVEIRRGAKVDNGHQPGRADRGNRGTGGRTALPAGRHRTSRLDQGLSQSGYLRPLLRRRADGPGGFGPLGHGGTDRQQ